MTTMAAPTTTRPAAPVVGAVKAYGGGGSAVRALDVVTMTLPAASPRSRGPWAPARPP